ncbi:MULTISPECIES: alpha/beta fold hydrolase [unclassified Rhodococcus (in: high G+C Gram-positive bacteria)]|uniref:alpha/beta fold hydrolase n=1 Tax=unclassified Rhodococcus (in: high G+C Gram-positive bacteria) TaxID=192944 RepID=UPI00233EE8A3|nr:MULTISPECIES: alpha/beta hydrolase [unclassified Rhodococcus (in: high G+C Gram-positive bacteria)]WSE20570.1 alpha/beta hydrolase [Rhodococcus sp. PD04]
MHVDVCGLDIAFERTGTGPAVVLAHGFVGDARSTWGHQIEALVFHRHRRLISSLTLVGGYAGWLGSLGLEESEQRLTRSLEASRLHPDEFVATMAPSMFSDSADSRLVAPFLDSVRAFHPDGFRAMARASYADQRYVLAEVDVPTLLVYSDRDVRAPVSLGEDIHREVPGSELVVLAGPGHVSTVEAPNDVTRELRRFLRSVESPLA